MESLIDISNREILKEVALKISLAKDFYNFSLTCKSFSKIGKELEEVKKEEYSRDSFNLINGLSLSDIPPNPGYYYKIIKELAFDYGGKINHIPVSGFKILPNGSRDGRPMVFDLALKLNLPSDYEDKDPNIHKSRSVWDVSYINGVREGPYRKLLFYREYTKEITGKYLNGLKEGEFKIIKRYKEIKGFRGEYSETITVNYLHGKRDGLVTKTRFELFHNKFTVGEKSYYYSVDFFYKLNYIDGKRVPIAGRRYFLVDSCMSEEGVRN